MSDAVSLHTIQKEIDGLRCLIQEREARSLERHNSLKENIGTAMASSDKAITVAAKAMDARVSLLNEFRHVVETRSADFATKAEIGYLREALGKLEAKSSERSGATAGSDKSWHSMALILAAFASLVALAAFVRGL